MPEDAVYGSTPPEVAPVSAAVGEQRAVGAARLLQHVRPDGQVVMDA